MGSMERSTGGATYTLCEFFFFLRLFFTNVHILGTTLTPGPEPQPQHLHQLPQPHENSMSGMTTDGAHGKLDGCDYLWTL